MNETTKKQISEEFDNTFSIDMFVSAHKDWIPNTIKQFIFDQIDKVLESDEIKELKEKAWKYDNLCK